LDGNIFGGLTPVRWESRELRWDWKAGASLKSFLFTPKNPHNILAPKFALTAGNKDEALFCYSCRDPHFRDICVDDNCKAHTDSFICDFGTSYANDTGLGGEMFFTGSMCFKVKEIEVFDITG
jgi:hypothetical protein